MRLNKNLAMLCKLTRVASGEAYNLGVPLEEYAADHLELAAMLKK